MVLKQKEDSAMSTSLTDDVLEEAKNVSSIIATARNLLTEGKAIDLPTLEGKIQALCENAEAGNLEQSTEVQDALSAIVAELGQLNAQMNDRLWGAQEDSVEQAAKNAIASLSTSGDQG